MVYFDIYDILGRRINTLFKGKQCAGKYIINWDGKDEKGIEVQPGVYFFNLTSGKYNKSKTAIIIK